MLLFDKKKIAQVILSERPEKKDKEVPQGIESDFSSAQESLASEMIEGLKNDNPRMVSQALKRFVMLCEKEEEYSEPEGE